MALTEADKTVIESANYIHTTSPKFKKNDAIDYNALVHRISNTSLISLIYGLQQSEFGLNTVTRALDDICKYNDMHMPGGVRMLDSGGYSIIAGDVSSSDVLKVINCYEYALNEYHDKFERILTLDVPFFINEPKYCTKDHIYSFNLLSLNETIKAIEKHGNLKNKLMFIQQFKMPTQYRIFDHLYNKLEIWKHIDNHAVGGLVGLGGACPNLNFAPFIGPVFLAFHRFLKHRPDNGFFNLHILGQYHLHARMCLIFLERLIGSLPETNNVKISYDSINFLITSQFKIKAEHRYCRIVDNETLVTYNNLIELDRNELINVYPEHAVPSVELELDIIKGGNGNVKDVSFATPLYAYSQLQIDQLFHQIIDDYDMVNTFKSAPNARVLKNHFNAIINTVHSKYAKVLGTQFTKKLLLNIQLCYAFYSSWYMNDRSDEKIDDLMMKFITKIGFPADLA